jgi:hypothetical protein
MNEIFHFLPSSSCAASLAPVTTALEQTERVRGERFRAHDLGLDRTLSDAQTEKVLSYAG